VMDVGTALFAKRRYDRRGGEARAGLSHEAESRASSRRKKRFAWWNSCFCYGQILKL